MINRNIKNTGISILIASSHVDSLQNAIESFLILQVFNFLINKIFPLLLNQTSDYVGVF